MLIIIAFLIAIFFPTPALSVEIIKHWVPSEVYGFPEYGGPRFYELYKETKTPQSQELIQKARKLYDEGNKLNKEGKKKEAESEFQKSKEILYKTIDLEPGLPQVYYWLGVIETALGNIAGAEVHFTQYKEYAPNRIKPYLALADHYRSINKLRNVRDVLLEALKNVELKPLYNYILNKDLGVLYYNLGNYTQAEFYLQRALENLVYEDDHNSYLNTAFELARVYRKHADIVREHIPYYDALNVLSEIAPLAKYDNHRLLFDIYALRGYVNGMLGNYAEAEVDFKEALRLNKTDKTTKNNLNLIKEVSRKRLITPSELRVLKIGGYVISSLGLILIFLIVTTFYNIQCIRRNKRIEETTMLKGIVIGFVVMVIGLLMPYLAQRITSVELPGGIKVNLHEPQKPSFSPEEEIFKKIDKLEPPGE